MEDENWRGLRVNATVDASTETRVEESMTTHYERIPVHFWNLQILFLSYLMNL